MPTATWNGHIIAQSQDTVVVDGNHYFPPESVNAALLTPSTTTSVCGWKGTASYHHITTPDGENRDAAWYYPEPKSAAASIKGRIAFWKGVKVAP